MEGNSGLQCELSSGVYYCPRKNLEWDHVLIKNLLMEIIPKSIIMIKELFSIRTKKKPIIYFLHKSCYSLLEKKSNLPKWLKAFNYKNLIFLLIDKKENNWEQILLHEISHWGISLLSKGKKIIPNWFNEAVACIISENIYYNEKGMYDIINSVNKYQITDDIINDNLIDEYKNDYMIIIHSIARFFLNKFKMAKLIELIKIIFKQKKDFNQVFVEVLEIETKEFISNWYYYQLNG